MEEAMDEHNALCDELERLKAERQVQFLEAADLWRTVRAVVERYEPVVEAARREERADHGRHPAQGRCQCGTCRAVRELDKPPHPSSPPVEDLQGDT
jgi:hypothetical protein